MVKAKFGGGEAIREDAATIAALVVPADASVD
jgi:hypothetical protein